MVTHFRFVINTGNASLRFVKIVAPRDDFSE